MRVTLSSRVLVLAAGVPVAMAQPPRPSVAARPAVAMAAHRSTAAAQPTSSIAGIVYDSLFGAPVRGAGVQLVSAEGAVPRTRTVTTDADGRYVLHDVPSGQYTIGFFHPKLDSLGLAPIAEPLTVSAVSSESLRRDLAIPSAPRIRAALCGRGAANAAGTVLMGIVRDARTGDPVAGATVAVEWAEFVLGNNALQRRTPRTTVTSGDNGWYAFCHVPSPGTVVLMASRGRDSTDFVETQLAADGFRRHELYLGTAQTRVEQDGRVPEVGDSLALPARVVHVGEGRLRGVVRHASSGRPIAGVQVGIVNGPQTRSNARGEWELVGAPEGTRRLEARAVGFYPDRQTIDVVAEAAPVELSLATLRSVLDTVKVTARYAVYSVQREFMERARSGVGRYITAADIQRSNPLFITDMLRNVPGLWVDGIGGVGDVGIQMRGLFTSRCSPTIVMNGLPIPGLFAADIDGALYPEDIMGIEIYRAGLVPPQFLIGVNDVCGAIVIWRK